ncbi:unnamed protein product [Microthlaspi erraticum]|uniref:EXPERA domain-containing protein n=1 Tax=Microthlaspi erraticum TaxID=1685480 RepID=A0A6D2KCT8_9BRAS|nr:unnamed protein product [Microthlaspi erraticum]
MEAFCKAIDAVLLIFYTIMAVGAPLIDFQIILPGAIFPTFLVDLYRSYTAEFGDYLLVEKPHFLVGFVWQELLFLWPLSVANLYAILARKSWFGTTSMLYGASLVSHMAAVLGDMIGSGKASDKMLMMYVPFLGFGVLALLRGLLSQSNNESGGKRPIVLARRKRA